jgi:uncharacterized protein (TIGR02246 family)
MTDEDKINELLRSWRGATAAGDLPGLLSLTAEDVVFLAAGQPPLRGREAFAAHFRAALEKVSLEPTGQLQEIGVMGEFAYCWNDAVLRVIPRDPGPEFRLAGPDLTILRKEPDGRWVVFRAASMLTAGA